MLLLAPEIVRFESFAWEDVESISIDRIGKRVVEEFADGGPYASFVDVPEQSVAIRVQRRITGDDLDDPPVGTMGQLVCYVGTQGDAMSRRRVLISCVLTAVRSELPVGKSAVRTLTFLGASDDGDDPVLITPATEL